MGPAQADGAGAERRQHPDGVERDRGVLGARLDDEVATGAAGVERIAAELRERHATPGRREARPGSENARGPNPNVIVRRPASMPSTSPLSAGTLAAERGCGAAGSPRVIRSAATDQRCISERSSLALSVWVETRAAPRRLLGVVMPRWWAPKNGIDSRVAVALAVTSPTASPAATAARRSRRSRRHRRHRPPVATHGV